MTPSSYLLCPELTLTRSACPSGHPSVVEGVNPAARQGPPNPPGDSAASSSALLQRKACDPGPALGCRDHPQEPRRDTSSPLAAAQSSCQELLSSARLGGGKRAGETHWPDVLAARSEGQGPGMRGAASRFPLPPQTDAWDGRGRLRTPVFAPNFARR